MGESGSLTISKPFISDRPADIKKKKVSSDSHNGDKEKERGNRFGTKPLVNIEIFSLSLTRSSGFSSTISIALIVALAK